MEINGVDIKDTYAEGFGIKVTRMLITAATKNLAKIAAARTLDMAPLFRLSCWSRNWFGGSSQKLQMEDQDIQ